MRTIRFDLPGSQAAFETCLKDVIFTTARRDGLDRQIAAMAADNEFTAMVDRLCCRRGIAALTGFALAVEVGAWTRFDGSLPAGRPGASTGVSMGATGADPTPRGRSSPLARPRFTSTHAAAESDPSAS